MVNIAILWIIQNITEIMDAYTDYKTHGKLLVTSDAQIAKVQTSGENFQFGWKFAEVASFQFGWKFAEDPYMRYASKEEVLYFFIFSAVRVIV